MRVGQRLHALTGLGSFPRGAEAGPSLLLHRLGFGGRRIGGRAGAKVHANLELGPVAGQQLADAQRLQPGCGRFRAGYGKCQVAHLVRARAEGQAERLIRTQNPALLSLNINKFI